MSNNQLLFQLNTRVYLNELSVKEKRKCKIEDIPDSLLKSLQSKGINWLWLLGVWQTGKASRDVSRIQADWIADYRETLGNYSNEDVCGSCFAIKDYKVSRELGGRKSLEQFRKRLKDFGIKLMLDFVPNHMALDHPWLGSDPDFFIQMSQDDLVNDPNNHVLLKVKGGEKVFAYGRDPYFDGWPDTVQLDYTNPALFKKMQDTLLEIAGQCDGVRCDMAMLLEPDIFQRTWGIRPDSFWQETIPVLKSKYPTFALMAEVYWDMEWTLQQQGFDFTYDKRMYDRLVDLNPVGVGLHLTADLEYQSKMVRFLENHDEQRANRVFDHEAHKAAAIINYFTPGLKFFHQGQLEGKVNKISPHLCKGPKENLDKTIQAFYKEIFKYLALPAVKDGEWSICEVHSAGDNSFEKLIAFSWRNETQSLLIVVNYSEDVAQGHVRLKEDLSGSDEISFHDLTLNENFLWKIENLRDSGLYVKLDPWKFHFFELLR